jgi:hypothetical protein
MSRKQVSFLLFATTLILVLPFASPPRLAAQASGNAQQRSPQPHPSASMPSRSGTRANSGPQTANIPYFTLRDGMTSMLTLNNSATAPTAVTVTIFNTEGRALTLQPMTLNPQSVKQLNLAELVPTELFDSGNIQVAFDGVPFEVNCQVSIFSLDKRVDIESRQQDVGHFESSNLNGIVSLPYSEAQGFFAVTSTATDKVTAEITVLARTKQVVLSPRETRLIDLGKEFAVRPFSPALVQLKHNGMPGDIIAAGFVLGLKNGYSSVFPMGDPAIGGSTTLAGAHFRAGQADPSDGFFPGTQFRAPLFLANVGTNPVTAHISVDYTVRQKLELTPVDPKEASVTEDKFSTVFLKDLTITPGDVQQIELSNELARLGITGPLKEAGVDITYDGRPGDILGQLTSVDQTGDYSFEVPIRDAAAKYKYVGGAYPWTLEAGTNTTLHLKNATSKKTYALVQLFFPDGRQFLPDRIVLQPHQTVALDIQRLKIRSKLISGNMLFRRTQRADCSGGRKERSTALSVERSS